jgi:hypothetical protein
MTDFVVLGTIVALLDLLFIFFVVPESLPARLRVDQKVSWDKIDPFAVCFWILFC